MDYISTFYNIIKIVTDFLNFPIPERLYIYLEKWYPYFISFLFIAAFFILLLDLDIESLSSKIIGYGYLFLPLYFGQDGWWLHA